MTFEAKNSAARCLQKLYRNRDSNSSTDYVIQAVDGKEIKVHSFILKSRCTDFFDNSLRVTSERRRRRNGRSLYLSQ